MANNAIPTFHVGTGETYAPDGGITGFDGDRLSYPDSTGVSSYYGFAEDGSFGYQYSYPSDYTGPKVSSKTTLQPDQARGFADSAKSFIDFSPVTGSVSFSNEYLAILSIAALFVVVLLAIRGAKLLKGAIGGVDEKSSGSRSQQAEDRAYVLSRERSRSRG